MFNYCSFFQFYFENLIKSSKRYLFIYLDILAFAVSDPIVIIHVYIGNKDMQRLTHITNSKETRFHLINSVQLIKTFNINMSGIFVCCPIVKLRFIMLLNLCNQFCRRRQNIFSARLSQMPALLVIINFAL